MNPYRTAKYHIYLLQLENYDLKRFWRVSRRHQFQAPKVFRKEFVWTPKMTAVASLGLLYYFFDILGTGLIIGWLLGAGLLWGVVSALAVLVIMGLFPNVYLVSSTWTLRPLDKYLKSRIVTKAKDKMARFPNLKIIGIAGSFGKTTTKEFITAVLSQKYKVLATPENINTPLGISRLILDKLDDDTQILVAELGEYTKGDIAELCGIARPHIGVITGINEAHLERMGSLENTVEAVFELAENMHQNGTLLLNIDSKLVAENYKKYTIDIDDVKLYSSNTNSNVLQNIRIEYGVENVQFEKNGGGQNFDLIGEVDKLHIRTPLLGGYIPGIAAAAVMVAKDLGLNTDEIAKRLNGATVEPLPHRLQPIYNKESDVLVIDDSYNGNPDGAMEAVKVLARFADGRRKIYVTPGLVEMGSRSEEVHKQLGQKLAEAADQVILIKNSVTTYIKEGLHQANFPEDKVIFYDSASKAHADLPNIVQKGDVILFQNDWPENYV